MISEPDQARIKYMAESIGGKYRISDGELNKFQSAKKLNVAVALLATQHPRSVIVVRLTRERPRQWWIRGLMEYFLDGLSLLTLEDGRLAICTWAVPVPG
jgi:hypothetical protein